MKSIIGAFGLMLFVVCLALPNLVHADAEGASATGSFKFVLEDGETRFVEFNATETPKNQGGMVKAKFDCMQVVDTKAVIGGEIYDSNVKSNMMSEFLRTSARL